MQANQDDGEKDAANSAGEAAPGASEPAPQTIPGCEVIEFDEEEGQQEWADSVFVQEFTDSVL